MTPNLVDNLSLKLVAKVYSAIRINHECLMVGHVCDIYICAFLVYVHDVIDDFWVFFARFFIRSVRTCCWLTLTGSIGRFRFLSCLLIFIPLLLIVASCNRHLLLLLDINSVALGSLTAPHG